METLHPARRLLPLAFSMQVALAKGVGMGIRLAWPEAA